MRCRTSEDSSVISPSLYRRQGSMSKMRSTIRTKAHMPINPNAITHITGSLTDTPLVQSDVAPSARKGPAISANGTSPFSVGRTEEVFTKVNIKIGALRSYRLKLHEGHWPGGFLCCTYVCFSSSSTFSEYFYFSKLLHYILKYGIKI